MTRPRVRIGPLMGLIVALAVGLAALRDGSDLAASAVFTALLIAAGLAALAAFLRDGRSRAAWAAFAAFGLGYAALAFAPGLENSARPRLLTTRLLGELHARLYPDEGETAQVRLWSTSTGRPVDGTGTYIKRLVADPNGQLLAISPGLPFRPASARTFASFQDVGHALAGWLAAFLGLAAASALWREAGAGRRG